MHGGAKGVHGGAKGVHGGAKRVYGRVGACALVWSATWKAEHAVSTDLRVERRRIGAFGPARQPCGRPGNGAARHCGFSSVWTVDRGHPCRGREAGLARAAAPKTARRPLYMRAGMHGPCRPRAKERRPAATESVPPVTW